MTIADMVSVLHARVLCGEERLATPVYTACCSDLMSDVLAFVNEKTVLITGLTNHHVLRTADMLDIRLVIFVRGKQPGAETMAMARETGITVLATPLTLYIASGILYLHGLRDGTKG